MRSKDMWRDFLKYSAQERRYQNVRSLPTVRSLLSRVGPLFVLMAVFTVFAGCPGRTKRTLVGPAIEVPESGNSQARQRFQISRSRFERDASAASSSEFESIVRDYPSDPIVPHALLYGAMADVRGLRGEAALQKLSELFAHDVPDEALRFRATLFRGLALSSLGRSGEALPFLRAGANARNLGDIGELTSWHAGLAEGLAETGYAKAALEHYGGWWVGATASERLYIRDRVAALSIDMNISDLSESFSQLSDREGGVARIVGTLLARRFASVGDPGQARSTLSAVAQMARDGDEEALSANSLDSGNPDLLGSILPLSGRLRRIGELSLRGLVMAQTLELPAIEIMTRDSNSNIAGMEDAVLDLGSEGVIAIVGPFDGATVASAGPVAKRAGIPLLSLAPRGQAGDLVFGMRHSAEVRAQALARYAYGKGVRDFAILSPKTAYGRAVGLAFEGQVMALGGSVLVKQSYARGTTAFSNDIAKLKKPWSALFVPDQAKTLALIAPALAAANLNAQPLATKSKYGRSIWLLSTAEGIDKRYLRAAGRYSFGAVFAPGFYADRTDPFIADFVARYESEFHTEPGAYEAYAYDAAAVVRNAVDSGARSRAALVTALRLTNVAGLTGAIHFGTDQRRSDSGLLFEVQQPLSGQYDLRVLRAE